MTGLTVEHEGTQHEVRTTRGVLIASGGFESADDKATKHLGAPMGTHVSPRGHNGIALQLSEEIGAEYYADFKKLDIGDIIGGNN